MAHHRIIIETREALGGYRAEIVEGPEWMKECGAVGYPERSAAYATAKRRIEMQAPRRDTLDFLHVHAQETT